MYYFVISLRASLIRQIVNLLKFSEAVNKLYDSV